ncbi:hypothetical protein OH77DRAFT_1589649 [Trametes cingulata]|nr:hypothetical protein OH77DRAFT_1589649 [Trametes cingulata]
MPLDHRQLLLNGLQPSRLSSGSGTNGYVARPTKRQKTEGMNSRFDRMIQTVNVMHGAPSGPRADRRRGRERAPSSSSGLSYDVPRTPLDPRDVYGHHEAGPVQNPSMQRTKTSTRLTHPPDMFAPDAFRDPDSAERLPPWLRGTISSLDPRHPIHLLVPADAAARSDSSPSGLGPSSDSLCTPGPEDSPFAFTAPVPPARKAEPPVTYLEAHYNGLSGDALDYGMSRSAHLASQSSQVVHEDPHYLSISPGAGFASSMTTALRPFSTPGPASTVGVSITRHPSARSLDFMRDTQSHTSAAQFCAASAFEQDGLVAGFVPFSAPGPLRTSAHANAPSYTHDASTVSPSPPRALLLPSPPAYADPPWNATHTSPLHPHATISTSLGSTRPPDDHRPTSGTPCSPVLEFRPYTTRGPAHARPSPSPLHSRSQPLSPPAHSRPPSAELYLSDLGVDHPATRSPLLSPRPDISALDFKWERFDPSKACAQLSSSPRPVVEGSEETFWSQPAVIPSELRPPHPVHGASSPPVLQQDAFHPSPVLSPGASRELTDAHIPCELPKTPVSHQPVSVRRTPEVVQEDHGPFAWIVQPRDQPPPSTPRRKVADTRSETVVTPRSVVGVRAVRETCSVRGGTSSDNQRDAAGTVPLRRRALPFLPAPGNYASGLRGEEQASETGKTPAREVALHPSMQSQGTQDATPGRAPQAPTDLPVTPKRPATFALPQDEVQHVQDELIDDDSSQPLCAGHTARDDREASLDEEIEEVDELGGCSQESRGTIESWSH